MPAPSLKELHTFLDGARIRTDDEAKNSYGKDWTKFFQPNPLAVLFPKSTEEVQKIVHWARQHKVALVPSGGRTGLSGAAVACQNEVVVSFDWMDQILELSTIDQTCTVQAGVVLEKLQNYVRDKGYLYPIDFAAKGTSQVGGTIATNAGGVKVVRYGMTRDWVAGLRVVTGRGDILDCNRALVKNASGYDLRHLMIGSEGTLGLITEATLKLTHPPQDVMVMVLGVPVLGDIMNVYQAFQKLPLTAFEMFSNQALKHVLAHSHLNPPFSSPSAYYVLIEVELTGGATSEAALEIFENAVGEGWVIDGVVSQSEAQAKSFWRLREDISESLSPFTPYKNDLSVRISQVPEFLTEAQKLLHQNYPDFEVVWFGHIGDGNLHINILKPDSLDKNEFMKICQKVDELLFTMIAKFGGSISAEHGVGLIKKPFLQFARSPAEIDLMKLIKAQFDPDQILNPGKIF